MATLPREAMQQAAMARAPQPGAAGPDVAGQLAGLLDQVNSLVLQPQNFQFAPIVTDWARNWLVKMIQLAKSKGAGGPGSPAQAAPTPTQPTAMPTGAPAAPIGAGQVR